MQQEEVIEEPKNIDEAKAFCKMLEENIQETHRQTDLEDTYTKTVREIHLKAEELSEIIKKVEKKKTKKNVADYNEIYDELIKLQNKQNELYDEISKYRTITPEQKEKGFL